jgi:hypothetical protein
VQRVSLGGAKDRTLADALEFAGLRAFASGEGRDENKVKPVYGFGIPLVLLLATGASGVYRDDNLGLAYYRWHAKDKEQRFPPPGSAALDVKGVVLRKPRGTDRGEYSLPLYWYEPKEEDMPGEGEAP